MYRAFQLPYIYFLVVAPCWSSSHAAPAIRISGSSGLRQALAPSRPCNESKPRGDRQSNLDQSNPCLIYTLLDGWHARRWHRDTATSLPTRSPAGWECAACGEAACLWHFGGGYNRIVRHAARLFYFGHNRRLDEVVDTSLHVKSVGCVLALDALTIKEECDTILAEGGVGSPEGAEDLVHGVLDENAYPHLFACTHWQPSKMQKVRKCEGEWASNERGKS